MASPTTPVYVQLPDDEQKTLTGEFSWDAETSVGSFAYDAAYLKQNGYLLDPRVLKAHTSKEVRNKGVYGVFRDAGPDAWGRDLLTRLQQALSQERPDVSAGIGGWTRRRRHGAAAPPTRKL